MAPLTGGSSSLAHIVCSICYELVRSDVSIRVVSRRKGKEQIFCPTIIPKQVRLRPRPSSQPVTTILIYLLGVPYLEFTAPQLTLLI